MNKKLLTLFFLSGATALIYQLVWTRLLTLFFGSTTLAVSTVLTAFMGGLALGAALLGKRADTAARPIRFYAWLELGIGLFAVATPLLFSWVESLYIAIQGSQSLGFWGAAALRFGLAILLLLPPTLLMGGTLPVLSKFFLRDQTRETGNTLGILYFINTAGAVVGTLAAGLFLLQWLGTHRLLLAGGVVNAGIFLFAYRWQSHTGHEPARASMKKPRADSRWSYHAVLATAALFVSGLAALIYEVMWTRVLTLIIGSSIYAFTIMLATFLTGIALGSVIVSRFLSAKVRKIGLLALCQVMIGVFALITASIFGLLPDTFVALYGTFGDRFSLFLTANFLLCFLVMVPATLFMGASFPVAGAVVVDTFGRCGRRIGLLYAGNTLGAILGAFLAGFVLLPWLGVQNTLVLTILINLTCGLVLALAALEKKSPARGYVTPALAASLIFTLVFLWQPSWDRLRMTSGPYAYPDHYLKRSISERLKNVEQLFYREGPIATVSVIQEGEHTRLLVDGKTDAGNFMDMTTQVLVAHLPLLIKPDAKDVLVIGFASGITAGAVGRHEVKRIDCVEIEPAMQEASAFFAVENYRIQDDPRFNLIIDDGRSYVLTTKRRYDIVISEPSNPWQTGSSRLFTREAFLNARQVLKKNGLMVQWMHLYGVDVETFRLVARTFASVFPHTTLWLDPTFPDVVFIGSVDPVGLDPLAIQRLYRENPRLKESLSRIGYAEDWSFLKAFLLGDEDLKRYAGTGVFNTDALPLLEYRAPKSLYSATALPDNLKALSASRSAGSFPAINIGNDDAVQAASVLVNWSESLAQNNFLFAAQGALARASGFNPADAQIHSRLGYLRLHAGDTAQAIESFETAIRLNPKLGSAYANLGTLYYQRGELDLARRHLRRALALGEDSASIRNNLAVVLARMGRLEEAIREVRIALSRNARDRVAHDNLERFLKLLDKRP